MNEAKIVLYKSNNMPTKYSKSLRIETTFHLFELKILYYVAII